MQSQKRLSIFPVWEHLIYLSSVVKYLFRAQETYSFQIFP